MTVVTYNFDHLCHTQGCADFDQRFVGRSMPVATMRSGAVAGCLQRCPVLSRPQEQSRVVCTAINRPTSLSSFQKKECHLLHSVRQTFQRRRSIKVQSVLATAEATVSEKYAFQCEGAGRVAAFVERYEGYHTVHVTVDELPMFPDESLFLHWGTYRSSSSKWFHPSELIPANSYKDNSSEGMRSPMETITYHENEPSYYALSFDIPAELLPVTVAFTLFVEGPWGGRYVNPRHGKYFAVPVGMTMGYHEPLGASLVDVLDDVLYSINFAVRSRNATGMSLCLARDTAATNNQVSSYLEVALDPVVNRTGDVWHVCLEGLKNIGSLCWGWRADGDVTWAAGDRFEPGMILLDPYAPLLGHTLLPEGVHTAPVLQPASSGGLGHAPHTPNSPTGSGPQQLTLGSLACINGAAPGMVDEGRPVRVLEESVILELDVATFTAGDPEVTPAYRGKFLGILDRLDYIKAIGANVLLLTPLYACTEGLGIMGRVPLNYLTPDGCYASSSHTTSAQEDLKHLLNELHALGIEVWMQVEFCFTAESGSDSQLPTSLRGFDGSICYRTNGVLNCGHPAMWHFIRDVLKHWALEYNLDGFCVVNAETLCIDGDGLVLDAPPAAETLALDSDLRQLKLVGWSGDDSLLPRSGERGIPHWGVWLERNNRFTEDFKAYLVEGRGGMASSIATRITGSADLFAARWDGGLPGDLACGRRPAFGVNSLTSLGRMSMDQLLGMNASSKSLAKAVLVCVLMSQGLPLITQDAVLDAEFARFVGVATRLRQRYLDLMQPPAFDSPRDIRWHAATENSEPNWEGSSPDPEAIGYSIRHPDGRALFIAYNPSPLAAVVYIPDPPMGTTWNRIIDTGREAPDDALIRDTALVVGATFGLTPQSAIVLEAITTQQNQSAPAA